METIIKRKIVHIKARPTMASINNLIMLVKKLKNSDNIKIPKIDPTPESILLFCEAIEKIISGGDIILKEVPELAVYNDFHRFEEAKVLSPHVYVSDNKTVSNDFFEEEDIEEDIEEDEESDILDSEEDSDDGYEFYEEQNEEDEFSD